MFKQPAYNINEMRAIENADRVFIRVFVNGRWLEQDMFPAEGQTVRQKVAEVQAAQRHLRYERGINIYVAADVEGQRLIAAMPTNFVPEVLKR